MDQDRASEALRNFLEGRGIVWDDLSPHSFLPLLIDYFREVEFSELDRSQDGDMLLFQYGVHDWGDGRFFEVNFTRQFYEVIPITQEHEIYQQSITFYYDPRDFEKIESFNVWSNDLNKFEDTILQSAGFIRALDKPIVKVIASVDHVC